MHSNYVEFANMAPETNTIKSVLDCPLPEEHYYLQTILEQPIALLINFFQVLDLFSYVCFEEKHKNKIRANIILCNLNS